MGAGLLLQGAADGLARSGHLSQAIAVFPWAFRSSSPPVPGVLLGAAAARTERIWVSLALGVGLFASYVMLQPFLLNAFDELTQMGTLVRLLDSHTLFPTNNILPVSPYYPGLELATSATKWVTGLPLIVDQLVVLTAVRIVLVLGVFLVVERVCRSSRAGGIGVLVYAASPQSTDSTPSMPTRRSPLPLPWERSISSSSRSTILRPKMGDHSCWRSVRSWRSS